MGLVEVVLAMDIVMTDVLQRILSLVGNELLLLQAMLEHAADVVQPVGAGQVPPEAGRFQPLLAIGFALPQQGQTRSQPSRRSGDHSSSAW